MNGKDWTGSSSNWAAEGRFICEEEQPAGFSELIKRHRCKGNLSENLVIESRFVASSEGGYAWNPRLVEISYRKLFQTVAILMS